MPNYLLHTPEGRAAWLAERRRHVMASDLPCILGLAPWRDASPLHIYLEKLGAYERPDTKTKRSGRFLEQLVQIAYEEETGVAVAAPPETLTVCPDNRLLGASLDGEVILDGERCVWEAKAPQEGPRWPWGDSGTDAIPHYYNVQLHGQMLCSGLKRAVLAAYFPGGELRHYQVRFHPDVAQAAARAAHSFWNLVEARTPPPLDYSDPEATRLLLHLFPEESAEEVILGGDTVGLVEVYEHARLMEKSAREQKNKARAAILHRMGEATLARCAGRQLIRAIRERATYTVHSHRYVELTVRTPKGEPATDGPPEDTQEGRVSA